MLFFCVSCGSFAVFASRPCREDRWFLFCGAVLVHPGACHPESPRFWRGEGSACRFSAGHARLLSLFLISNFEFRFSDFYFLISIFKMRAASKDGSGDGSGDRREVSLTLKVSNRDEQNESCQTNIRKPSVCPQFHGEQFLLSEPLSC